MGKTRRGNKIRAMVAGGLFYPEEKTQAEAELVSCGMKDPGEGKARAVLVPHCAWSVSGKTTAGAFLQCPGENALKRIVLLGALHHSGEQGLFLSESDFFETPLGNIPVSRELCGALASCSARFEVNDIPHLREHAYEVVLPFIKYRYPRASLVPVLLGGGSAPLVSALARALRTVFAPILTSTLFVIPSCASVNTEKESAEQEAKLFLSLLSGKKPRELMKAREQGKISACGTPLTAALLGSGL
ncbi:MAG: AmmeMemoRadiSam system protein B, partial [Spirochaetaceae bacterium]|nr:AmmeMemoRadiSam system protein B [Spirochaetaceae bacterium]